MSAAFGQLYYTSCEHGLGGYPGFQFNASTPGVRPEVMADVEALSGYEPPRELALDAGVAQLDRYPVNLCFRPGGNAVLANTVFVGNDYSHRFGNYFAHALVSDDVEASLGGVLPIELWRAPFWTSVAVSDPALPELPAPPQRGPLDRASVDEFVRAHRCFHLLPALLTAVDEALRDGKRKVVLVDHDADAVANWIAAVSYLLPENLVRRMSFTTYQHQPRYCGLDVVGTVPGSEVDRSAFDNHLLFDMVADRSSTIDTHPLAELLTDLGVLDVPEAWKLARRLVDGTERGLDEWHPVLAAAVLQPNFGGPAHAAAVSAWLAVHAERLGARVVSDIGSRVVPAAASGAVAAEALQALAGAARAVGARELSQDVELAWVDVILRSVLCGQSGFGAADLDLFTAGARARASDTLARDLPWARPETVVDALAWAARSGVELGEDKLRKIGDKVFGPMVVENRTDERSRSLLGARPPLRWGAVNHLVTVAKTDLERVVTTLASGIGDLLEVDMEHKLVAAVAVAAVRSGRLNPAEALREITTYEADAKVLQLLWPAGAWTHGDALAVLHALPPEELHALRSKDDEVSIVLKWLEDSVLGELTAGEEQLFDQLCALLEKSGVYRDLSGAARIRIDRQVGIRHRIDGMVEAGDQDFGKRLEEVCRSYWSSRTQQRREMVVTCLLGRLGELSARQQAQVLVRLPVVRDAYLHKLSTAGVPTLLELKSLVLVAWQVGAIRDDHTAGPAFKEIECVMYTLRDRLRRKEVRKVAALIERRDPVAASWFTCRPRRHNTGFWPFRSRTERPQGQ